ncbi:MAG TPA: MarR family winged helix-turn-helix transcriptional regulator [Acidimicrobiia bacterium]|nr:MarR family winged helix-turn-helix transcriptional regulator [Acidimicrobiia bacterium]
MKPSVEFLGRRIAWTHRVLQAELDARMRERGGDFTTWKVLVHLVDGARPSQRELAAGIRIDPATVVRHLDRLESEGLVTRERDERDRRVIRVALTPDGRRVHDRLNREALRLDGELADVLSPHGYQQLGRLLARVTDHFAPRTEEARDDERVG